MVVQNGNESHEIESVKKNDTSKKQKSKLIC